MWSLIPMSLTPMSSLEKRVAYRNGAILKAAENETCTLCKTQDGTTVFAHFNNSWAGKGTSQKADDCAGMFLCQACHHNYDNPGISGYTGFEEWEILRAYYRTIRRLLDRKILK